MNANDRVFFDTNIVFYAYDSSSPAKQQLAQRHLADALQRSTGFLSVQVLGEFFHATVVRRQLLTSKEADRAVTALTQFEVAEIDASLVRDAIGLHRRFQLRYWDALILATARRYRCKRLLSEDFAHEQDYDGVRVVNPFVYAED